MSVNYLNSNLHEYECKLFKWFLFPIYIDRWLFPFIPNQCSLNLYIITGCKDRWHLYIFEDNENEETY